MNKSLDMQAWKFAAVAIVLALVLPIVIEFALTAAPVAIAAA